MTERSTPAGMSLARRLLIGAAIWSLIVLVGGAVALSAIYRNQTLQLLDEELDGTLIALSRAVEVDEKGALDYRTEALPSDPAYGIPLSGRYWAIVRTDEGGAYIADLRPQSLWDGPVPWPAADAGQVLGEPGSTFRLDGSGPNEEPLRMAARSIILQSLEEPVLLVAAFDRQAADESADRFTLLLVGAMGALAAGVLAAMWIGVRVALQPLSRVGADIADIREGRSTQLSDDYPAEVRPLTAELNKLLEHNKQVVERAQTHVGNLAHALKTPLAVLRNEAAGESALDSVVRRQTEAMHANVDHYLRRAQAAARAETLTARTPIQPSLDALARTLNRLFSDKTVAVSPHVSPMLAVRVERQDLDEMLGNLVENACKWAEAEIEVSGEAISEDLVRIVIDDDGLGLAAEDREAALKRGVRLDETAPGTGLGLNIVMELAEMHGGSLELFDSPMGGLRAALTLRRG